MNPEEKIARFRDVYDTLRSEIGKIIVGQEAIVDGTLNALFANGHVLLEGVPGLGKTLLVRTLSQVLDLSFSRVQFTPDLMPADVLGTNMVHESDEGKRVFEFQHGPIFAHLVLADEINRATPKTQSAMLEAMQERSVTAGGEIRKLDTPFSYSPLKTPSIRREPTRCRKPNWIGFFTSWLWGIPRLKNWQKWSPVRRKVAL